MAASVAGFDAGRSAATSPVAVAAGSVTASLGAADGVSLAGASVAGSSTFLSGGRNRPIGGRNGFAPPPPIWIEGRAEAEAARPFWGVERPTDWRPRSGNGSSSSAVEASSASCRVSRSLSRTLFAVASSTELEWVFLSTMPTAGRTAITSDALTSSSLASSLIRIFLLQ